VGTKLDVKKISDCLILTEKQVILAKFIPFNPEEKFIPVKKKRFDLVKKKFNY
jgi:hypothetical protein